MHEMTWIVPLLLLVPAFWLLRVILIMRLLLGLRLRPAMCQRLEREAIPAHHIEAAEPSIKELEAAGFSFRQAWKFQPCNGPEYASIIQEMVKPDEALRVLLRPHDRVEFSGSFCFSVCTSFQDGRLLSTLSTQPENLLSIPKELLVEYVPAPLAVVLEHHRKIVAQLVREGAVPIMPTTEEVFGVEVRLTELMLDQTRDNGELSPQSDGTLTFRVPAAFRIAKRLLKAAVALKRQKKKATTPVPLSSLRPESQVAFDLEYYEKYSALRKGRMSGSAKTTLMFGSLVLFALALGWQVSATTMGMLLAALFVHEGGHLLGMRIFGYKDTQLLFLPFLGGAAVAHDTPVLAPWKHLVILFLGPLPGIFAALVVLYGFKITWLSESAWLVLTFNLFNLLPILPLDGGQIMDVSLFSRFPRFRLGFLAISGAALVAIGLYIPSAIILTVLGGLMLVQLGVAARTARTVNDARKAVPPGSDEAATVRYLLGRLRETDWAKTPPSTRLTKVHELLQTVRRPLPDWKAVALAIAGYISPLILIFALVLGSMVTRSGDEPNQQTSNSTSRQQTTPAMPSVVIPEAENAAILVERVIEKMQKADPLLHTTGLPSDNFDSKTLLDELHEAAKRPYFAPTQVSATNPLARYMYSRPLDLLTQEAQQRLQLKQPTEALAAAKDALTLLSLTRKSPDWLGWSTYCAYWSICWSVIEEATLEGGACSANELESLAQLADETELLHYAGIAVWAERKSMLENLKDPYKNVPKEHRPSFVTRLLLKFVTGNSASLEKQMSQDLSLLPQLLRKAEEGVWDMPNSKQSPILSSTMVGVRANVAQSRQIRAALAILWDEKHSGKRPQTLDQISAPWWHGIPHYPGTTTKLTINKRGAVDVLEFPKAPADNASPEESFDDLPVVDFKWRLRGSRPVQN